MGKGGTAKESEGSTLAVFVNVKIQSHCLWREWHAMEQITNSASAWGCGSHNQQLRLSVVLWVARGLVLHVLFPDSIQISTSLCVWWSSLNNDLPLLRFHSHWSSLCSAFFFCHASGTCRGMSVTLLLPLITQVCNITGSWIAVTFMMSGRWILLRTLMISH